ncbi:MAG: hypothetical protein GC160_25775 [Acidobacteria bacterium]|nr:hypothetical protein [Acidobacteriota bacterium]
MRGKTAWIGDLCILTLVATSRLALEPPILPTYDSVNFALALEHFDPAAHQPQPPGYPLFVLLLRWINLTLVHPVDALAMAGVIGSAIAVAACWRLGRAMFGEWAGVAVAVLLLVHPTLWYAGVANPVRTFLAAGSAVTALLLWRALRNRSGLDAAVAAGALAVAAGFRPELLLYLSPLWIYVASKVAWTPTAVRRTLALFAVGLLAWLGPLAVTAGGPVPLWRLNAGYLAERSGDAFTLRQLGLAAAWTFGGALCWVWALGLRALPSFRLRKPSPEALPFLAVWTAPGFLFQALAHIHHPDQALQAAPPVCLAGAYVLTHWRTPFASRDWAVAGLLLASGWISFLGFRHPWPGLERSTGYFDQIELYRRFAADGLTAIEEAAEKGRIVLLAADPYLITRRHLGYYFPETPIVDLLDGSGGPVLYQGLRRAAPPGGTAVIPLPADGTAIAVPPPGTHWDDDAAGQGRIARDRGVFKIPLEPNLKFTFLGRCFRTPAQ